jgi:hypothetical protein
MTVTLWPPLRKTGLLRRVSHHLCLLFMVCLPALLPDLCCADPPAATALSKPLFALSTDVKTRAVALSLSHAPMSDVIVSLAKQGRCNIIVNDEPRDNQADIEFKGTFEDALNKVADAYDYTWTVNKQSVILMTKRFSRQNEYPPLNAGELHQTAEDSLAAISTFKFSMQVDPAMLIRSVYASLTPEQQTALKNHQKILGRQLSDAQRLHMQDAILHNLLAIPSNEWDMFCWLTDAMAKATPTSSLRVTRREFHFTAQEQGKEPAKLPATVSTWFLEYVMVNKRGKEEPVMVAATQNPPAAYKPEVGTKAENGTKKQKENR